MSHILWFKDCSYKNKHLVGGKCSSLGELYYLAKILNFDVADGFAITTTLYDEFIEKNNLQPKIEEILNTINTEDLTELDLFAYPGDVITFSITSTQSVTAGVGITWTEDI